jgi:hypothetical protein
MKPNFLEVDFTQQIIEKNKLKQAKADSDGDNDTEDSSDTDDASTAKPSGYSMPTFIVGDKVKNVKQDCSHCGSEGLVTDVKTSKADDDGDSDASTIKADDSESDAMISYKVTNSGPNWKPGDSITRAASYLQKC